MGVVIVKIGYLCHQRLALSIELIDGFVKLSDLCLLDLDKIASVFGSDGFGVEFYLKLVHILCDLFDASVKRINIFIKYSFFRPIFLFNEPDPAVMAEWSYLAGLKYNVIEGEELDLESSSRGYAKAR